LDKKAVNEVVDSLKEETATISDPQIKKIFTGLFDLVELLASENEKLTVENQQLKNEVNELKGEQGKPDVKPNKRNRKPKLPDININREHKCEIDQSTAILDLAIEHTEISYNSVLSA
jgi:regulator of replication initiation timing